MVKVLPTAFANNFPDMYLFLHIQNISGAIIIFRSLVKFGTIYRSAHLLTAMYNPPHFRVDDIHRIVTFIRDENFAIILSSDDGGIHASNVPLMVDEKCSMLRGHFARANTMWKNLEGKNVLVLFPGPNHYISPVWYGEEKAVPTWNYATVEVRGIFNTIQDDEMAMEILDGLVDLHEGRIGQGWRVDWTKERYLNLLKALIPFEISVKSVEGKWKLSQDHPLESRRNAAIKLKGIGSDNARKIAEWMESS